MYELDFCDAIKALEILRWRAEHTLDAPPPTRIGILSIPVMGAQKQVVLFVVDPTDYQICNIYEPMTDQERLGSSDVMKNPQKGFPIQYVHKVIMSSNDR